MFWITRGKGYDYQECHFKGPDRGMGAPGVTRFEAWEWFYDSGNRLLGGVFGTGVQGAMDRLVFL